MIRVESLKGIEGVVASLGSIDYERLSKDNYQSDLSLYLRNRDGKGVLSLDGEVRLYKGVFWLPHPAHSHANVYADSRELLSQPSKTVNLRLTSGNDYASFAAFCQGFVPKLRDAGYYCSAKDEVLRFFVSKQGVGRRIIKVGPAGTEFFDAKSKPYFKPGSIGLLHLEFRI